jgi:hypothetical protein
MLLKRTSSAFLAMSLQEDFIRRAYTPKEVAPAFKSAPLAVALGTVKGSLPGDSKSCYHLIPKFKHFRRLIALPNPLHQTSLGATLQSCWDQLLNWMAGSQISLSALRRKGSFEDLPMEKLRRSSATRFMVRADLSRFCQTLYTHGNPWALHGKVAGKSNKKAKSLVGNSIDAAVRNTQDEQTLGIPVGPETSDRRLQPVF